VRHFTLVSDSDRFESAMRMHVYTARGVGRREEMWRAVVEHDERIHSFHTEVVIGNEMVHFESIANEMGRRRGNDLLQGSVHGAKVV
jgi:hypothetical protein